jgi:tripartite-type tricarboxylate transporter receptor subunit TctC
MTHVPYRGSGAALIDVIDGHVPAMFDTLTSSAGHIKAGKLRPLATGGEARHPSLPDVPTFIELGYSRMLFVSWFGLCTPAGLPADILSKLSAAVTHALKSDEVKARFAEVSFTTQPTTPAEFTAFVREEVARWAIMIQEVGATAD